ncbi:hypothetical protein MKK67_27745 [Methylobacterium sp. J-072]|uniref:hypothetical protein n=1 Tax=Methylobacterium sp. J-072 TaxID=2836651 RepID=UPI001FBA00C2|nr:hypothetical protein [Methylobacterium sp. J-072]MCJ2096265.1 hypothetical protein [Methylobacterium sp. J-072]
MFNTVKLAKTLEAGGLSRDQADLIASGVFDSLKEYSGDIATKGDLKALEAAIRAEIATGHLALEKIVHAQTKWLLSALVGATALMTAMAKFLLH